jgi:predicted nucleic acid-binding protein
VIGMLRPNWNSRAGRHSKHRRLVFTALDELAGLCVPVAMDYRWRPVAADPDDDMVVETAINGRADLIVTFNISDMRAGAEQFGVAALRPASVSRRLRS